MGVFMTEKFLVPDTLSNLIKEKMKAEKISYEELAEKTGVSKAYLTNIIVHRKVPSKEIIEKIADNLNIDPQTIRELRVLNIFERVEYSYLNYLDNDFKEIENSIRDEMPIPDKNGIAKRKSRMPHGPISKDGYRIYLDISTLPEEAIKVFEYLLNLMRKNKEFEKEIEHLKNPKKR